MLGLAILLVSLHNSGLIDIKSATVIPETSESRIFFLIVASVSGKKAFDSYIKAGFFFAVAGRGLSGYFSEGIMVFDILKMGFLTISRLGTVFALGWVVANAATGMSSSFFSTPSSSHSHPLHLPPVFLIQIMSGFMLFPGLLEYLLEPTTVLQNKCPLKFSNPDYSKQLGSYQHTTPFSHHR